MPTNKPSSIKLYYFSGTGNAAAVSRWIAQETSLQGKKVDRINISKIRRLHIQSPSADSLIGFVSATHGFNFPPIMFHFLLCFPRGKGNRVFIINTRAGMKLGKYFLPGLSGMALYLSAIILILKGYKIQALKAVDLPSNWISIHPGLKKKVSDSIIDKRKEETRRFSQKLLQGKRILRGLYSLPADLLITPIGILYYIIGRFFLAKTFIASKDCTGCGLCNKSCPVNAIKIVDKRRFWTYKCESCMKCMNRCPERAIETAHGFVALIILVLNAAVLVSLNRWIDMGGMLESVLPFSLAKYADFIFNNAILLAMMFVAYRVMHFLLQFSIFERLFVLTSFTHWNFWRRYRFIDKSK